MTVHTGDLADPPDTERHFTGGIEQFHHPRRVRTDRRNGSAPTPQRTQLLAGLSGRVLEIGAGDGVKLTCYPAEVEEIVLVEADASGGEGHRRTPGDSGPDPGRRCAGPARSRRIVRRRRVFTGAVLRQGT